MAIHNRVDHDDSAKLAKRTIAQANEQKQHPDAIKADALKTEAFAQQKNTETPAALTEKIEFSPTAKLIHQKTKEITNSLNNDFFNNDSQIKRHETEKLKEIRDLIQKGEYPVDAEKITEKIIESVLDFPSISIIGN